MHMRVKSGGILVSIQGVALTGAIVPNGACESQAGSGLGEANALM